MKAEVVLLKRNVLILLILISGLIGGLLIFIHFKNIPEPFSDIRNGLKPSPTTPSSQVITIKDQSKPETDFSNSQKPSSTTKTFTPTIKAPQNTSTSSKQEDQLSTKIYHLDKFIVGVVIDDSDKPIAGALIKISIENFRYTTLHELMKDKVYEEYKSDSQGKFKIQPFALKGYSYKDTTYVLMITAEGYTGKIVGNIKPDKEYLKIVLYKGERYGKVLGKVINEKTSEPIPEADIFLFAGGVIPFTQFKSDANGEFVADKLIPGHYNVKAKKGTFGTSYPSYFAISEDEIKDDVVLKLIEAYTITGKVLEKGTGLPITNLEVQMYPFCDDGKTKTDKDGIYTFEIFHPFSESDVRLFSEEYIICKSNGDLTDSFEVNIRDYENHYIINEDIYVTKGVKVSGMVVGPDKKPIKDARLWYFKGGHSKVYDTTDNYGKFCLAVIPESIFQFQATADGFIKTISEKYLIKDKPVENIVLIMNKGSALEGEVLIDDSLKSSKVTVGGFTNYQEANGEWDIEYFGEGDLKGTHFKFESVRPGLVTLFAMTDNGARSENVELKLEENDYIKNIILKIEEGFSISGRVLKEIDEKNEPIKDVTVYAFTPDDIFKQRYIKTDDSGFYKIRGMKPGYYTIRVYVSGYDQIVKRDIKAGSTDVDFIFKKEEAMKISGRVINRYSGEPIPSFTIETRPYQGKGEDEKKFEFNDSEGKFELPQLLISNSYFTVSAEGYQPSVAFIYEKQNVYIIRLSKYKKATGRVLSEMDNQSIPNATLRFIQNRSGSYIEHTDEKGEFLCNVFYYDEPKITLKAEANSYFTKTIEINIDKGDIIDVGDIYLKKKAGKVFGTVYDQYKIPIKNVMVTLNYYPPHQKLTDTNGYYEFTDMNLGEFSITLEEFPEIFIKSELKEDKFEEQIDIYLKRTVANFEILLRNQGVRNVNLSAESKSFCFRGATDIDGKFSIKGIPGGEYSLILKYGSYHPDSSVLQKVISLEENKENNFKFEINDSLITGHTSDFRTFLEAFLINNQQSEKEEKPYNQTAYSQEDNYFEFRYLPEGDYIIFCYDVYRQRMILKKISVGWSEKIDNLQINSNDPAIIELMVRDNDTKMPIKSAKISLNDMDFCCAVTDDNGKTTLCGLWEDDYKLKISAYGYKELTEEISVYEGDVIKREVFLSKM